VGLLVVKNAVTSQRAVTAESSAFGATLLEATSQAAAQAVLGVSGGGSSVAFNRFANGALRFDQTNLGVSITVNNAATFQSADCVIGFGAISAGTYTMQQIIASPPPGYSAFLRVARVTRDATPAAGSGYQCIFLLEGADLYDFRWGTADAKPISISFLFRTSMAGTLTWSGSIRNDTGLRSYPFTWQTTAANTWTTVEIPNIPGDIAGTWLITQARGMMLTIDVGSGATLRGAAGVWSALNLLGVTGAERLISSAAADSFDVTGVQLAPGTTVAPFEVVSTAVNIFRLKRYLEIMGGNDANELFGNGPATATTTAIGILPFLVEKRGAPTITANIVNRFTLDNGATTSACTALTFDRIGLTACRWNATAGAVFAASQAMLLRSNIVTARITIDARL